MVLSWAQLGAAVALPLAVLAKGVSKSEAVAGSYIVEFNDAYSDMPSEVFLSLLATNGVHATPRRTLSSSLFHGLSFTLTGNHHDKESTVEKIASMPEVSWISPVQSITAPANRVMTAGESTTWDVPHAIRARQADGVEAIHQMTGVDRLREEGYVGTGIKVAVVDSGIDYTHPALGGCFGEGCLVSFGADLVGDDFSAPSPSDDPYSDCNGHGTHVSGIVAAQPNEYGFTGVAPNVTLGMYRVLDCRGRGSTDLFIDAFLRAFDEGADIITASLGEYSGWSEEKWSVVIARIAKAGVPCLVAVGNDGYYGPFYASNGAPGKDATGVGSLNSPLANMFLVKASYSTGRNSTGAADFGYIPATRHDFTNGTYPLHLLSRDITVSGDACGPLSNGTANLSDKVVLVRRGGCSFNIKAQNVADAGGKRVLFYNNEPGIFEFTVDAQGIESAGMVPQSTGEEWINLSANGSQTIDVLMVDTASASKLYKVEENKLAGGFVSYFTQWGPTNELDLLPTVLTPGGHIMSTYPLTKGGYAVESGTSMATPYLAGCIALMIEARGKMPPATINALLSANADPKLFHDGRTEYPWLGPVIQQGGGLANVYDAVHATTFIDSASISFNDTEYQSPQTFTVHNRGSESVVFTLGQVGSATVYVLAADGNPIPSIFNYADFPEMVTEYAQLSFDPPAVVVGQNEKVTVRVSAMMPPGLNETRIPIYNGYITLNGTNGDSLSIPYLGIASAMRDVVILDTQNGENRLASSINSEPIVSPGHTFYLPAPNSTADQGNVSFPSFNLRLAMGSRLVNAEVKSATSNRTSNSSEVLGSVPGFPKLYQSRNAVGPTALRWDGTLSDGKSVPAGSYSLLMRALKIFGDQEKPEDYDVIETPQFSIRYI